jgi:hypothetical protein
VQQLLLLLQAQAVRRPDQQVRLLLQAQVLLLRPDRLQLAPVLCPSVASPSVTAVLAQLTPSVG